MVARGLPNIYYQQGKSNAEETREYIEQKTREGKKLTRNKARLGGPS